MLSDEKRVHNAARRPHVDLKRVAALDENLRSNVVRRATQSLFPLIWRVNSRSESKIAEFQYHIAIYEDISELKFFVENC